MPVVVSMLRGVNLGSHKRVQMDALRKLYVSLRLRDPRTYVQSGNVIFATDEKDLAKLAARIAKGIATRFGFDAGVMLRTAPEMRSVVARNPFAKRKDVEPGKLLVAFLSGTPARAACAKLLGLEGYPEERHADGRHVYIHYPNGQGRSKFTWALLEKTLAVSATGRNWNSVTNMLAIAEELEA